MIKAELLRALLSKPPSDSELERAQGSRPTRNEVRTPETITGELSADERSLLSYIKRVLDVLQTIRVDFPMGAAGALVMVALNEGGTVAEYTKSSGAHAQSLHRQLLDLTDRNRFGRPGYGLIEPREAPEDRRARRYYLTAKGRELLDRLQSSIFS